MDPVCSSVFHQWIQCVPSPTAFTQRSHCCPHSSNPWSLSSSSFRSFTAGFQSSLLLAFQPFFNHLKLFIRSSSHNWTDHTNNNNRGMNDITEIRLWQRNNTELPNRMLLGFYLQPLFPTTISNLIDKKKPAKLIILSPSPSMMWKTIEQKYLILSAPNLLSFSSRET